MLSETKKGKKALIILGVWLLKSDSFKAKVSQTQRHLDLEGIVQTM